MSEIDRGLETVAERKVCYVNLVVMGMFKLRIAEKVVSEGHVAKERHPWINLAWKYAGGISLGRPKRTWERSSESDLTETVL